jgi:hypothetical protein
MEQSFGPEKDEVNQALAGEFPCCEPGIRTGQTGN